MRWTDWFLALDGDIEEEPDAEERTREAIAQARGREERRGRGDPTPFIQELRDSKGTNDADRRAPKWAKPLAPRPKWLGKEST